MCVSLLQFIVLLNEKQFLTLTLYLLIAFVLTFVHLLFVVILTEYGRDNAIQMTRSTCTVRIILSLSLSILIVYAYDNNKSSFTIRQSDKQSPKRLSSLSLSLI